MLDFPQQIMIVIYPAFSDFWCSGTTTKLGPSRFLLWKYLR